MERVLADTGAAPLRAVLLSVAAKMADPDALEIVARSFDLGHAVYRQRGLFER